MSKTQIQRLQRLFKIRQQETKSKPSSQSIPPKSREVEGKVNVNVPLNFSDQTDREHASSFKKAVGKMLLEPKLTETEFKEFFYSYHVL